MNKKLYVLLCNDYRAVLENMLYKEFLNIEDLSQYLKNNDIEEWDIYSVEDFVHGVNNQENDNLTLYFITFIYF